MVVIVVYIIKSDQQKYNLFNDLNHLSVTKSLKQKQSLREKMLFHGTS